MHAELNDQVDGWFTGRPAERSWTGPGDGTWGPPGNLAHRRPHRPVQLAAARAEVGRRTRTSPEDWLLMRQVHGAGVAVVDEDTPRGAELRDVDAMVTTQTERPLVVQVADCVPVLVAGGRAIAAIHAGRAGLARGVVPAAIDAVRGIGDDGPLTAVLGPAIGGCCYEVPRDLQAEVVGAHPLAASETTWGTPSLDLPAAVVAVLEGDGVTVHGGPGPCTRCDPDGRWFSHRADPNAGRQVGIVVRRRGHRSVARAAG